MRYLNYVIIIPINYEGEICDMGTWDKLKNTVNKDSLYLKELKENDIPLVMYGCGDSGIALLNYLKNEGIEVKKIVIDDAYYSNDKYENIEIIKISEIPNIYLKFNVIIGFVNYTLAKQRLSDLQHVNKVFCFSNPYLYLKNYDITWDYVYENKQDFFDAYQLMADDKSRELFVAYLNTRMNKDAEYLFGLSGDKTYFNNDIVALTEEEIFVDCGAYNGDSLKIFLKNSNFKYKYIYAFEPDDKNFNKLAEFCESEKIERISNIKKGVWSETKTLEFLCDANQESSIVNGACNTSKIEVDSLDNMIGEEPVTFIKLSVQGSEEEAILGAKNLIQREKPVIAATIFMKKDALIKLSNLIKKIEPRYQLYLRCEEPFFARVILYAIYK